MSLVIRDVHYLDGDALCLGDLAVGAGPGGTLRPLADDEALPGAETLDGRGGLALPGLVCAHHHLYSGLARGMPAPPRPPRGFTEILERVWWRLDRCLDIESIRASALAAGLDCLRCGVTAVIDHHSSPNSAAGALGVVAGALDELGLAHVLCIELSDRDGPASAAAGLAEMERYLASGRPGLVGLHASFTVGDALLGDAVALARRFGTGVHLHVAEGKVDQERCERDHGLRVVERLAAAGALELEGSLFAHCLHLSEAERALIRDSPAWVVHNPESNRNNGVGGFDPSGLDQARILVGTDGLHGDVLRSARAAALAGPDGLGAPGAWRALLAGRRYLEAHHPSAARANDVVLYDYRPPTPLAAENLAGHFAFGLDARQVRAVICDGRVVVRDGRFTEFNEEPILEFCREEARRLWDAMTGD